VHGETVKYAEIVFFSIYGLTDYTASLRRKLQFFSPVRNLTS